MDAKLAYPEQMQAVKQLWSNAFNDVDPYLSWYFNNVSTPENTVVSEYDGKVVASLQLIDYNFCIDGKTFRSYYIAGVCTSKDYRNQGFGRKIMETAFDIAVSRGKDFVFLCPAIDNYYERFGFEMISHLNEYTLPPSADCSNDFPIRKATVSDISLLQNLYSEYAGNFGGYTFREDIDFLRAMQQSELLGGGIFIVSDDKKSPIGYFVYEVSEKNEMYVSEIILPSSDVSFLTEFCAPHKSVIVRSARQFQNTVLKAEKPKYLIKHLRDLEFTNIYINILY